MDHKALRDLFNDTVRELSDNIRFGYGRLSDFNKIQNKRYPYVWSDVVTINNAFADNNVSNYVKTYAVTLSFLDQDEQSNDETQYTPILDKMATLADKFIHKLNLSDFDNTTLAQATDLIQIINPQYTRVIKDHADVLTGWVVSFNIVTPDTFDYCSLYEC